MASPMMQTAYQPHPSLKMKAAVWKGNKNISIDEVPKPTITTPNDAIVHVTHCTICGSDLHMYEGSIDKSMKKGDIMGHEAIGVVEEVGPQVRNLQKGDRVIIMPVIACGDCFYCNKGEYSLCDKMDPNQEMHDMYGHRLAGIFGYTQVFGGYPGDQAEFCRVPNADLVCVKIPKDIDPKKVLGLADVTLTAWHACELAEVKEGSTVGVWGCGPVGLSIQRLAKLRGAKKVYAMDYDEKRLQMAKSFGMIPVDESKHKDTAGYILSQEPRGLDCAIDAVGYRCEVSGKHKATRSGPGEGGSCEAVNEIIKATRKRGNVALIGDFFFTTNNFPIGAMMEKGITVRGGQLFAQKYMAQLLELVLNGKYDPSWMFTAEDQLENVGDCYKKFFSHQVPGGLKVLMKTEYGRQLEASGKYA